MNSGHCRRTWCRCWHAIARSSAAAERARRQKQDRRARRAEPDTRQRIEAMPRLAEEMAYKDGLLTWTEENVGELFACIAYKHLTNVKDEVDKRRRKTTRTRSSRRSWPTASTGGLSAPDDRGHGEDRRDGGRRRGRRRVRPEVRRAPHRHPELHGAFGTRTATEPWEKVKNSDRSLRSGRTERERRRGADHGALQDVRRRQIQGGQRRTGPSMAAMVHKSSKPKGSRAARRSSCPSSPRFW